MGVKLSDLVQKKQLSFEQLAGKKIAVDYSNSAYQFLSSIRQRDGTPLMDSQGNVTSHLMGTWNRFSNLMQQGIRLAVILDGKPPLLKVREQEDRAYRKRIAQDKFEEAQQEEDIDLMAKYAKQTSKLSRDMVAEAKELMKAMGLPVIQAPSEADAQMAFMAEKEDVFACASSDYDCLLHGTPRLLTNLTLSQKRKLPSGAYVKTTPDLIDLKKTLTDLDISQDQLIVIAILVGTDYNAGVKRIGPKTALKLVKQHSSFDKLFKEVKAEFNWKKIYAVFKSMPIMKNYQLKWSAPDVDKIKELLVEKHEFSEERVQTVLDRLTSSKKREQKGLGDFF
tara:strand:+ start:12198 stop:13208 length:1011 start_codon:yes stop_codon:yes gene_type:complete